eukprot:4270869-Prymnesium_polylepis.1
MNAVSRSTRSPGRERPSRMLSGPRASSRAHFGVTQYTTCDTGHFLRFPIPHSLRTVCVHHTTGGGPRLPRRSLRAAGRRLRLYERAVRRGKSTAARL